MGLKFQTNLFDIAKFVGVGLLVAFVFFNYGKFTSWMDRPKKPDTMTPRIERLEAGLVKYTVMANTKRLENLIEDLKKQNSEALAVLEKEGKKVDELTVVVTKMRAESKIQSGDRYKDEEKPDEPSTRDFADTVVYRSDDKGQQLQMSRVIFHANIEKEPWTIQNFPLELHTNVVQSEDDNGVFTNVVETYFTNAFVKSSKGKKYYFDSKVAWAKREKKDKKFSINFRLGFGVNISTSEVFPGLDLSLFSYGRTRRDLDYRFITLGIGGTSESIYGYFKPVEYNIGNFIPLVENMFIGPMIGVDTNTEVVYGGGLSVLF